MNRERSVRVGGIRWTSQSDQKQRNIMQLRKVYVIKGLYVHISH